MVRKPIYQCISEPVTDVSMSRIQKKYSPILQGRYKASGIELLGRIRSASNPIQPIKLLTLTVSEWSGLPKCLIETVTECQLSFNQISELTHLLLFLTKTMPIIRFYFIMFIIIIVIQDNSNAVRSTYALTFNFCEVISSITKNEQFYGIANVLLHKRLWSSKKYQ